MNTVDVIFPSWPIFLYTNPALGKYLLLPLFEYQATGQYPNKWSVHDMGRAAHSQSSGYLVSSITPQVRITPRPWDTMMAAMKLCPSKVTMTRSHLLCRDRS